MAHYFFLHEDGHPRNKELNAFILHGYGLDCLSIEKSVELFLDYLMGFSDSGNNLE